MALRAAAAAGDSSSFDGAGASRRSPRSGSTAPQRAAVQPSAAFQRPEGADQRMAERAHDNAREETSNA